MGKTTSTFLQMGWLTRTLRVAVLVLLALSGLQTMGTAQDCDPTYTPEIPRRWLNSSVIGRDILNMEFVSVNTGDLYATAGNPATLTLDRPYLTNFPTAAAGSTVEIVFTEPVSYFEYGFAVVDAAATPHTTVTALNTAGNVVGTVTKNGVVPTGGTFPEGTNSITGFQIKRVRITTQGPGYCIGDFAFRVGGSAIIAADETVTVPSCTGGALVTSSFQVLPCNNFNPNSITAVISPAVPFAVGLRYASAEGGTYLYDYALLVPNANVIYSVTIDDGPGGLDPITTLLTVNASNDPDPSIAFQANTVYIPSCENTVEVLGSVTIASCDQELDASQLFIFDQNGNPVAPSFIDADAGYVEFPIVVDQSDLNANPNFNFFTVTYTDALGNSTTVQPGVTARQSNLLGNLPTVVYPSNDIILELDPCEPSIPYTFAVTASDVCDGELTPVVTLIPDAATGLGPIALAAVGNSYTFSYPKGTHTVKVTATDAQGNKREESFKIIVNQKPVKAPNIACNSLVNVTLEEDCNKVITPDMVTEGNFGTCAPYREEDFKVVVYDGVYKDAAGKPVADPNNLVEVCGTFNYVVLWGEKSDEYCWGKIKVEDKTPPVVTCPPTVIGLVKEFIADKEWADYLLDKTPVVIGGKPYTFRPGLPSDTYCSSEENGYCKEKCDDKDPNFNYLVCTDLDKVLNVPASWTDERYAYFTGKATVFDCSAVELVGVRDILKEIDCSKYREVSYGRQVNYIIERTFTYRDKEGNTASCTQKIYFFRPEVDLPACKVELDKCKYPNLTASNTKTMLDPVAIGAVPTYVNAICQTLPIVDHTCNLTLTFEDLVLPGPDNCGLKVIRTWTLLDWCWQPNNCDLFTAPEGCWESLSGWENKKRTYEQHLIVGDKTAPKLACPEVKIDGKFTTTQQFVTGPFECKAVVNPLPPVVSGECMGTDWEFDLRGDVVDPKTGLIKKDQLIASSVSGKVVYGIAPGKYVIRYFVRDMCGNSSTIDCPAEVVDKIAPVAVCDDDLHISIGGAATTAEGLARVTAADVDEGSWDNCELAGVDVRREIETSCLEIYAKLVNGLVWPSDYDAKSGPNGSTVYLAKKAAPAKGVKVGDTLIVKEADGRFFSWWANEVYFTCCDISADDSDRVVIELRATDKAGNRNICWMDVLIEDKLPPRCEVHDKNIECTDLDFDPLATEKDPTLLHARFGKPTDVVKLLDNCGATITEVVKWIPGNCGTGTIRRTYTVKDNAGRSVVCTQNIVLWEVNDYSIVFPGDAENVKCGDVPANDIKVSTDACDILAVNRDTARFEAEGDSENCFKLLITYKVINWCEYDGKTLATTVIPRDLDADNVLNENVHLDANYERVSTLNASFPLCGASWGSLVDNDGKADSIFVVKVFSETSGKKNAMPDKILVRGTCNDRNTHVGFYVVRRKATGDPKAPFCYEAYCPLQSVANLCSNLTYAEQCWTPGYYEYTQILKVYDNTAPTIDVETEDLEFCAYGTPETDCNGQVDIIFTVDDECTPDLTKVRNVRLIVNNAGTPQDLTGKLYTVTDLGGGRYQISGKLPVGSHTFVVSVADGCGNLDGIRIPFSVKDCKSPAPICIQTLSVDLMPVDADNDGEVDGGMNTVWATDYIASPITDCSPFDIPSKVKYYIFKDADLPNGPEGVKLEDLTNARTSVVFTCEEAGESVITYVFALDAAGNFDYCLTMTLVRGGNAPSPCGEDEPGTGNIAGLISDENVNAVAGVSVQLSGQASMNYTTTDNGNYSFAGLVEGYDYSVTPSLDKGYLNGVSTFDLVLISKHILGVKQLDTPYKMIAADVNNSKSITTLDLIALRKLILSVDTKFANNTSWRFVDAKYSFPNPANPWSAQFPEVLNINDLTGTLKGDFMAVKIGDVNGNAVANGAQEVDSRNAAGTFEVAVANTALKAGAEYSVVFKAADLAKVQGYQFTLNFDRTKVELVDVIEGVAKKDNFGIFAEQGVVTTSWNGEAGAEELFTLVLRAKADAQLSQVLGISSGLTRAEAYTTGDELLEVALNFGQGVVAKAGFELYQNVPNPFNGQTIISFNLPEAAGATVKVSDVTGRLLKVINGQFNKGYNEVRLNSEELGAVGVLTYTVETAGHTATRKMVIIE